MPVDVLIYATGFQWMATSTFNMITGVGGVTLRDSAGRGVRTFLGLHSHGFPICSSCRGLRAAADNSISPAGSEAHTDYVVCMLRRCVPRRGYRRHRKGTGKTPMPEHCRDVTEKPARCATAYPYYTEMGAAEPGSLALLWRPPNGMRCALKPSLSLDPMFSDRAGLWLAGGFRDPAWRRSAVQCRIDENGKAPGGNGDGETRRKVRDRYRAGRGLGRAYARRLAGLGAKLAITDINLRSFEEFELEAKIVTPKAPSRKSSRAAPGDGVEMDVTEETWSFRWWQESFSNGAGLTSWSAMRRRTRPSGRLPKPVRLIAGLCTVTSMNLYALSIA